MVFYLVRRSIYSAIEHDHKLKGEPIISHLFKILTPRSGYMCLKLFLTRKYTVQISALSI
jgi:hypothetical protein